MENLEPAIQINDLTKSFGSTTILNGLNFNIPKGKITTILGFSGAGKSTLLKHILGLLHPSSGQIVVLGKDLATLSPVQLREFRRSFGMLFQYAALFDSKSAHGNVAFPLLEFTNLDETQIDKRVRDLLLSVGIKEEAFL